MRRLMLPLSLLLLACAAGPRDELAVVPEAADWRPLLVQDVAALMPGPPPSPGSVEALRDREGLRAAVARRRAEPRAEEAIARWGGDPALAWAREARALAGSWDLNEPARAARALALAHAAIYDAILATWAAKRRFARPGPALPEIAGTAPPGLPSYPSEHAAAAMAVAGVLAHVFPHAAAGLATRARAVAEVPVAAGLAFPADVAAGRAIGERVAEAAIARARGDEAATPAPAAAGWRDAWPLSPEAGAWAPWTLGAPGADSAAALRAVVASVPPPAAPGSAALRRELAAARAANRAITIRMRALAIKWGEVDMARQWHDRAVGLVERYRLPAPEAARVLAYAGTALADAAIASWAAQYAHGRPRPSALDPAIAPVLAPPAQPAYPADGAAMAIAAAHYLAAAFPQDAAALAAEAEEAAQAGLFAGWHLESDVVAGKALGRTVGERVLARARLDGRP